jgi:hypothetical protein
MSAADLAQLGYLLVDLNIESGAQQRQRGCKTADATADDRN